MRLAVLLVALFTALPALAEDPPAPAAAPQEASPAPAAAEEAAAPAVPEQASAPAEAEQEAAQPAESHDGLAEGSLVRITLADGQVLRGTLVRSEADKVVVSVAGMGKVALARSAVSHVQSEEHVEVRAGGELWFKDPNRTRYLYSPSAVMLKKGEGYFSQKELLFSSVAYGVTDYLTVVAGTMVPAWFAPNGQGINFIGGLKLGGEVARSFHLAAGAEALFIPGAGMGGSGLGFVFGTATYEWPTFQLSLSGGRLFLLGRSASQSATVPPIILAPSANWRVGKNISLVTENWVMPFQQRSVGWDPATEQPITRDDGFTLVNSLAMRFFGEQWSADVGLIRLQNNGYTVSVPIPWLDFTYHFK